DDDEAASGPRFELRFPLGALVGEALGLRTTSFKQFTALRARKLPSGDAPIPVQGRCESLIEPGVDAAVDLGLPIRRQSVEERPQGMAGAVARPTDIAHMGLVQPHLRPRNRRLLHIRGHAFDHLRLALVLDERWLQHGETLTAGLSGSFRPSDSIIKAFALNGPAQRPDFKQPLGHHPWVCDRIPKAVPLIPERPDLRILQLVDMERLMNYDGRQLIEAELRQTVEQERRRHDAAQLHSAVPGDGAVPPVEHMGRDSADPRLLETLRRMRMRKKDRSLSVEKR